MAGGKLSPRQKMINMMYLVLTAMLALNVSAEILEAFRTVQEGINNSTSAVEDKVRLIDEALAKEAEKNPDVAGPLLASSKDVNSEIANLIQFIDQVKHEVTMESGGYKNGATEFGQGDLPNKPDDYDGSSRILAEGTKGKDLKQKINDTRVALLAIVEKVAPQEKANFENNLTLEANDNEELPVGNPKRIWEYKNFYHVPIGATVTILDKIKNDAVNAQASINEFLLSRVGAVQVKIDKLAAQVMAESSYLPSGGKYDAKIFLAASSSNLNGKVYLGKLDMSKFETDSAGNYKPYVGNGEKDLPVSNPQELEMSGGMANYTGSAGVGSHSYSGVIQIPKPGQEGKFDNYPFTADYEVAPPAGLSISPTKMNVLYIGVDNPLSITVGDAKPGTVSASINNGTLSNQGNGKFVARPTSAGKANISVSGKNAAGANTGGSMEFRVKFIPDPIPTLGGDEALTLNGKGQKGTIKAKGGIVPLLKDFDFEARFTVESYDFYLTSGGDLLPARGNSGPMYSGTVNNLIDRAKPNDLMVFDNIKVKGPDGKTRKIPSMSFQVF
ncbi:MAG: gliding motility protein GldM [Chitinophagales bacterium]|nr:gliding motility protein GldM [Chitinophagales bacterium]